MSPTLFEEPLSFTVVKVLESTIQELEFEVSVTVPPRKPSNRHLLPETVIGLPVNPITSRSKESLFCISIALLLSARVIFSSAATLENVHVVLASISVEPNATPIPTNRSLLEIVKSES